MRYTYPVHLEPDPDGGLLATFRDVPEVVTGGADRAKSLTLAADALGMVLCHFAANGMPLPIPSPERNGEVLVAPQPNDALKIAVLLAFAKSGISKAEFGRRLGRADMEVRRILDPLHGTKIETMQAALAAFGMRAIVEIVEIVDIADDGEIRDIAV